MTCLVCHADMPVNTLTDSPVHLNNVVDLGNNIESWDPERRRCANACHDDENW